MQRFLIPFLASGLFWLIVAVPWGETAGRRARALDALGGALDWLLVQHLTLPGSVLFVFLVTLYFTIAVAPRREA